MDLIKDVLECRAVGWEAATKRDTTQRCDVFAVFVVAFVIVVIVTILILLLLLLVAAGLKSGVTTTACSYILCLW